MIFCACHHGRGITYWKAGLAHVSVVKEQTLFRLLLAGQGHKSVAVERHMGNAVRVSVAVVEGHKGPVAFIPSQEHITCPEADFMDAMIEEERREARLEVTSVCRTLLSL